MLRAPHFRFGSPPSCGNTWLKTVLPKVGNFQLLENPGGSQHAYDDDDGSPRVTTVRHPVNWLLSIYKNYKTKKVGGQNVMDNLLKFTDGGGGKFEHFIRDTCRFLPGYVGYIFSVYAKGAYVMKLEEYPNVLIPMLQSFGYGLIHMEALYSSPLNVTDLRRRAIPDLEQWNPVLTDELRAMIMKSESEHCERYGYG